MNPIIQILKTHNVSSEKISTLFQTLTENPLAAMASISTLGIPEDELKSLMMMVMSQPQLIQQAVEELGLDFSKVEEAKAKFKASQTSETE